MCERRFHARARPPGIRHYGQWRSYPSPGLRPPDDWAGHQAFRQAFGSSPSQTSYLYDQAGHQLAQYVAPGATATTNEYIWLDDQAVGYVAINSSGVSTLQYVTTGQIDEPLLVTKASQTVSWNGYTDPFGLGATFPGATTVFNLRLPGQWWQPETSQLGLSLNGARNYDPTLGRYTQADPLGIDAGANPYAYVDGDPLNLSDPWGLAPSDFPPSPPGYNPQWSEGIWDNGRSNLTDPDGNVWTAHPEDNGHWPHWDVQDKNGKDKGQWPPNSGKPRQGQKKLKQNQCPNDPNGKNYKPWRPTMTNFMGPFGLPFVPYPSAPSPGLPYAPVPLPSPAAEPFPAG